MKLVNDFLEYNILQASTGEKIENWNGIILKRPDPEIIWEDSKKLNIKIDATYKRSNSGGGSWEVYNKNLKDEWTINYKDLIFKLKRMGFKHTGLFPEQAYNWNMLRYKIKNSNRKLKVLNLFAYTGAASIAALKEGAEVVHVDASRGMVDWAKENVKVNKLNDKPIRFLVDDCLKFVKREIRRGNKYDIIIMDPPSFGRGANKEVWSIDKDLFNLVNLCSEILSDDPVLFLINSYTTGLSMSVLENILKLTVNKKYKGYISSDELGLPIQDSNLALPCGIYARWEKESYKD